VRPAVPLPPTFRRLLARLSRRAPAPPGSSAEMERVFGDLFHTNAWGDDESVSGPGSNLVYSAAIRAALPGLLRELEVRTLLDLPCGDFFWMKEVDLEAAGVERYLGADVVPELIERNSGLYRGAGRTFLRLDLTRDPLPPADLVLCRDCLVHLSFEDAFRALANLKRSGSRYLLTTTFPAFYGQGENPDIPTGHWRPLDFEAAPFRLPPPLRVVSEEYTGDEGRYRDKSLGLWRISDL
jgi:hypothetical protein